MSLGSYLRRILAIFTDKSRGVRTVPQLKMLYTFDPDKQVTPPKLPQHYRLLRYVPGYEDQWVQLINSSGEFVRWNRDTLSREVLSGLLTDGGILVAAGDKLAACAAACSMRRFEPYAVLMYVVVLPEHRNRGLGTAIITEALAVCQREGYPGVILHTDDFRVAAIKRYLKLGFVPDIELDHSAKDRWKTILDTIQINLHIS